MKRYVMELVGSFFVTMAVTFTTGTPIAVGLMFMAMYYIGESVSGGYFNPVFSVAAFCRGVLGIETLLIYGAAQTVGALLAVWVYTSVYGSIYTTDATADMSLIGAILFELLIAAALGLVFLTMSTSKDYKGSVVNGAIIGLSITGMLYMSGLYNPAIALGSLLFQLVRGGGSVVVNDVLLQYVGGPLLGGAAAAFAYDFLHSKK